jgi:2-succinyl-5-enolpyruvyl-6-hydroxy-3-cyclohexene-1-carboxylate synthase
VPETTTTTAACNLQWSILLVDSLVQLGVSRFVISPGSRSTPLALAAARHPQAQHWVIVDERSAAFFALGQARQSGTASALICTSGSAVANWLPAVVEANHAAHPLLLLSADRPPELHGRGANQTIAQQQLFGTQVRGTHPLPPPDEQGELTAAIGSLLQQVMGELLQPVPGPVHINIPFREPLLPADLEGVDWSPSPLQLLPPRSRSQRWLRLNEVSSKLYRQPGVILCGEGAYGEGFATALVTLAEQLDCIILADPLSNLRWGTPLSPRLLSHYDGTLRTTLRHQRPHWVIQFGDFPLSSSVARWLSSAPPEHYLTVQHRRLWSDPESLSTETFQCRPEQFVDTLLQQIEHPAELAQWSRPFLLQEQQAAAWRSDDPLGEHALLQMLLQMLPAQSLLFSGNSMVIRDIDGWLGPREAALTLHANRGASGIDGNLSTLCGIRTQLEPERPMVALLGDLTLFHDLNALSLLREASGNLTLIVINNGGGNIFSYLPQSTLPEFEALWLTPPEIGLEQAATLYRLPYLRVAQPADLPRFTERVLQSGPKLVEWVVERNASIAAHQQYWESLQ